MLKLKEVKERSNAAKKICRKLVLAKKCPIELEEIKVIVDALMDLDHLNELLNYLGEEALRTFDDERMKRN